MNSLDSSNSKLPDRRIETRCNRVMEVTLTIEAVEAALKLNNWTLTLDVP
jgi:hypothetical protein